MLIFCFVSFPAFVIAGDEERTRLFQKKGKGYSFVILLSFLAFGKFGTQPN